MDTVSIVIPTHNHGRYVREAVDSALAQTYPAIEVVVVDDGSTDGTADILSSYVEAGTIRYVALDRRGVSAARNAGLRLATGRYVKFLDSDDVLFPDQVARQVAHVGGSDTTVSITDSIVLRPDGTMVRRHPAVDVPERQLAAIVGANVTVIHAFLVPRALLDRAGGFDEELTACEDWDLWIRVLKAGGVIARLPIVGCCYRILDTSSSADTANMFRQRCAVVAKYDAWLVGERHIPAPLLETALASNLRVIDEDFARGGTSASAIEVVKAATAALLRRQGRLAVRAALATLGTTRALRLRYALRAKRDPSYPQSLVSEGDVRRYGAAARPVEGRAAASAPVGRRSARGRGVVLMYHRIAEVADNRRGLAVSPRHFEEQMAVLSRWATPAPLAELMQGRGARGRPGQVAVTFDDGYADNVLHARPVLERYGVPATFFIVSGLVGSGQAFWWDVLEHAVSGPLPAHFGLTIAGQTCDWAITPRAWTSTFRGLPAAGAELSASELSDALLHLLLPLPLAEKEAGARCVAAWSGRVFGPRAEDLPMTVADVAALAQSPLFTIGAHTVSHPMLAGLPAEAQAEEIRVSRVALEAMIGTDVTTLAYPHGDCSDLTIAAARGAGMSLACTTVPRPVDRSTAPLGVPRFKVRDWTGEEFGRRLQAWLEA
jgi:peptidoglycan/xylan/chitin deacetylase (PgdA/CDA1 family)